MHQEQKKKYPVDAIRGFFNKNYKSIPSQPFWINEHLRYNNMMNTIKTYISIIESDDMDELIKASAFDKLKQIKDFIVEYQIDQEKYNILNAKKENSLKLNNKTT